MNSYDPWHALSDFEGVRLEMAALPGSRRGQIDFETRTITLHPRLLPDERRCTLAHELVHLERGPVLVRQTPREERIVAAIAARRLLPIEALADALRWSDDPGVLAEELLVDDRTIRTRLATLTAEEKAFVHDRLSVSM
jgi:hypothetical protein